MKALALDAEGGAALREAGAEPALGPQHVAVRVSLCYLDERVSDCARGPEHSLWPMADLAPHFLGWEVAGTVEAVGDAVTRCRVGDAVLALCDAPRGGCTPRVVVEQDAIVRKPAKLEAGAALAALKPGLLAYAAVHYKMRVQPEDAVLFTHAEAAPLAVQLTVARGGHATLLATSEAQQARLEALYAGCDACSVLLLPPPATARVAWREEARDTLLRATDGLGFDHAYCAAPQQCAEEGAAQGAAAEAAEIAGVAATALAAHGTLATRDLGLELAPQAQAQLAMRGGSLAFVSEYAWLLSPARRSQLLHVLEDLMRRMEAGEMQVDAPEPWAFDAAPALLSAALRDAATPLGPTLVKL